MKCMAVWFMPDLAYIFLVSKTSKTHQQKVLSGTQNSSKPSLLSAWEFNWESQRTAETGDRMMMLRRLTSLLNNHLTSTNPTFIITKQKHWNLSASQHRPVVSRFVSSSQLLVSHSTFFALQWALWLCNRVLKDNENNL